MSARTFMAVQLSTLALAYNGGVFGNHGFGPSGTNDCANPCITNFWQTADPDPKQWCDGGVTSVGECISSACSASSQDYDDYQSKAEALCSTYLSCSSTGTYTYTVETPGAGWWKDRDWKWDHNWFGGSGGGGGDRHRDGFHPKRDKNGDDHDSKEDSPKTVTVTGCPWYGDGFGFPFWHGLGYGSDFWRDTKQQSGWSLATKTSTVTATETVTDTAGKATANVNPSKEVVVVQAVSGDLTTESTVSAKETGKTQDDDGTDGGEDDGSGGDSGNAASSIVATAHFAPVMVLASLLLLV